MRYKSAETDLFRALMTQAIQSKLSTFLNGNIYDKQQDGIGYDSKGNKINPFSYMIVGETSITKDYSSASHTENIAVTFHLYHRDRSAAVRDNANELLDLMDYVVQGAPEMALYEVKKVRCDNKQMFPDVDLETMHGVLRMNYEVKHKLRYKE